METNEQTHKKRSPLTLALIVVVALAAAGAGTWIILNPSLSTDNATVERTKATVTSKTSGTIARIAVDEGDFVDAGSSLVDLDTAELLAQKRQAEANLVLVKDTTKLSQVALDRAQADFTRAQRQYQDKVIATEVFEHAEKAFESAQVDAELAAKRVEVAQAQVDLVNATLANTRMVSPFNAVVAKKWMSAGDLLGAGQAVLTLYDRTHAWVTANFDETKLGQLRVGQGVRIRVDAYPDTVFAGKISQIGVSTGNQFSLIPVNNAAGNFTKVTQRIPVKIDFDDPTDLGAASSKRLLPGMSAAVEITNEGGGSWPHLFAKH
jgi:membrane fusion protein (multidrug efflux system)